MAETQSADPPASQTRPPRVPRSRAALAPEDRQAIIAQLLRGDEPNSIELQKYKDGQYSWSIKLYFGSRLPLDRLVGADFELRQSFGPAPAVGVN